MSGPDPADYEDPVIERVKELERAIADALNTLCEAEQTEELSAHFDRVSEARSTLQTVAERREDERE